MTDPFEITIPLTVFKEGVEDMLGRCVDAGEWYHAWNCLAIDIEIAGQDYGAHDAVYRAFADLVLDMSDASMHEPHQAKSSS